MLVQLKGENTSISWIVLGSWLWQLIKRMTPVFLLGLGTGWFIWAKTKQKRYFINKQTKKSLLCEGRLFLDKANSKIALRLFI